MEAVNNPVDTSWLVDVWERKPGQLASLDNGRIKGFIIKVTSSTVTVHTNAGAIVTRDIIDLD